MLPAAHLCLRPCSPAAVFGFLKGFEKRVVNLRVFFRISVKKLSNPTLLQQPNTKKNKHHFYFKVYLKQGCT